ncbi:hypothetical protein BDZ94DRAFT_1264232 [Collybia nuda]|uniref:Uncharacterized protein n=1 Tax=Collybia nuda TaxID=64659 RepID=A0A9P5Y2P0_9AGAR|nr:hypothetical protein BDZ94DRAFT_1264232 [Collybia nuda]
MIIINFVNPILDLGLFTTCVASDATSCLAFHIVHFRRTSRCRRTVFTGGLSGVLP